MNQKLIIEAYKSIEYKGGEKLGSITVQINPDSYKLSKSTSYKKDESIKEDKQLPGKFVTFKQGDSLIGLCAKEYKNSGYAPMIASINNLISFRDIKPGTQLWFPKI